MFFDHWIIDHTCSRGMDRFSDPSHTTMEWRFRTNAAALAADVAGAGYDWEHAAQTFSASALEHCVGRKEAHRLLADAWEWGQARPSKWMDLTRRWVFVASPDAFYDLGARVYLSVEEWDDRFDSLCPLPGWRMSEFLLEYRFLACVDQVTRSRTQPMGFYEAGGFPLLNQP
jgi:hypothetical protein